MNEPQLCFAIPDWLDELAASYCPSPHLETRMALVLKAARHNIDHQGGPFAAGIFERDSGKLVALGVNRVLSTGLSILHAEIMAFARAQRHLGHHDLSHPTLPAHELVTSTEPCTMCLGATCWSGVKRVVSGASDTDARAIGFDEGPKPADWKQALQQRGIAVHAHVLRAQAIAILQHYRQAGGPLY